MDWKDVSLGKYYDMLDCGSDDELLCVLYDLSGDELLGLPYDDYVRKLRSIGFVCKEPELYDVDVVVTTGQWLDLSCGVDIREVVLGIGWRGVDCIGGLSRIESFRRAFDGIVGSYPNVFGSGGGSDSFSRAYGCLHLIMRVVELTLCDFDVVLDYPLCKTLNIVGYAIARSRWEEGERKRMEQINGI